MVLGWEGGRRQGEMFIGWVLHFLCLTYGLLKLLPILPLVLVILDEQRLALESSGCHELLGRVEQIAVRARRGISKGHSYKTVPSFLFLWPSSPPDCKPLLGQGCGLILLQSQQCSVHSRCSINICLINKAGCQKPVKLEMFFL